MRNLALFLLAVLLCINFGYSQSSIDGSFEFQSDPAKKYSLHIPSSYDESIPSAMMLGLHPLNVNRWDGQSWRDTLIQFAETNDLILVCPDGGLDGQIDSPIDTAFTSTLLDSVAHWYAINPDEKYIMGFSWGGKTTYTYGLRRTEDFKGYLIIGAAVNISEVNNLVQNANGEAFYLIHGSLDSPNMRYFPLLDALQENDACTASNYLDGVGHTIDFADRNDILTLGYNWLKEQSCTPTTSAEELILDSRIIFPNPSSDYILIEAAKEQSFVLKSVNGLTVLTTILQRGSNRIDIQHLPNAQYFYRMDDGVTGQLIKI